MWRYVRAGIVLYAAAALVGCGQGNERKNDAGPPMELVPGGPPAMQPPGSGDASPPGPSPKAKGK